MSIWVSKYLLNKCLEYGSKRIKQYGKLEFATVPVILPVSVFEIICWLGFLPFAFGFCIKKSWLAILMSCLSCLGIPWWSLASVWPSSVQASGDRAVIYLLHSLYTATSAMQNAVFNKWWRWWGGLEEWSLYLIHYTLILSYSFREFWDPSHLFPS